MKTRFETFLKLHFSWLLPLLASVGTCLIIFSEWLVVLVNRELSKGSVNWPRVRRRKGIATPSGSGNASIAAWNDSIDLYCVKHTEQQQQWHLKRHGERQRSNRSQTHFWSSAASHCSGFLLIQLYYCDVFPFCKCRLLSCFVNKNAANLK